MWMQDFHKHCTNIAPLICSVKIPNLGYKTHRDLTGFLIGEVTDLLLLFEVQSQHEQIFGGRAVREHQSIFRCHKFAHVNSIGICS